MGVDRPGGRAPLGSGGVAGPASWARRALFASRRDERVDLPSALSAQELARRLDARIGEGWSEWHGRGVSVHREPYRYRLTPRGGPRYAVRPRAFVQVVPAGDGARLTGVIRSRGPSPVQSAVAAPFLVAVLVYWFALAGPGMVLSGLVFVAAMYASDRVRFQSQRERLREFLDEVAAS